MKMYPKYPSLYQINTRVWLTGLSRSLGRKATLDDIPDSELDKLTDSGFDWIWFLSVWQTGKEGQIISRTNPEWRKEFQETLPDLREQDIGGSGFAVTGYTVHSDLGGNVALRRLREKLRSRGLKLMLDFVPNHMGPDHSWVRDHPEYFVQGSEEDLEKHPGNYRRIKSKHGELILAYGRDPYFEGWPDTIQLDYSKPSTIKSMIAELLNISGLCDGVRCDMAMLVLPEVFERTWGRRAETFWPVAIKAVHNKIPDFCFMAEVYWDMEWTMMQNGFDYAYDKRLYDRLHEGNAIAVKEHFYAGLDYQNRLARFLENHDEPRAATTFSLKKHEAAAVITFLSPGLRFFHQGQLEGRNKRISPHLVRAPIEKPDQHVQKFYRELLSVLKNPIFRDGDWSLLNCIPAWEGNDSWNSFLVFFWEGKDKSRALVIVNYSSYSGQCYVYLPFSETSHNIRFIDLLSPALYERDGNELLTKGFYLDMHAWGYHIFEVGS
jgi:glycosidase